MKRAGPFLAGMFLLAALWLGPLPEMARRAFSPHMILHLGVTVVAAPLIAVGLLRLWPETKAPSRPLLAAVGVTLFELAAVWGWHAPLMHEWAARSTPMFVLQQLSFLLAGMAVWLVCLVGRDATSRGIGTVAMLFTSMHMTMLGILLVTAPMLLYAPQFCLGAFGFSPLDDQRFGGALMASAGTLPYVGAGGWLALSFFKDNDPRL
ncbi:MAG TPA: cytochrome c oxidase assembly protein [Tianweitania sediminis]|jgi:putative membrane protein|nr:cytochrome c oxidase assembly protein [Tianweitania sediminis]